MASTRRVVSWEAWAWRYWGEATVVRVLMVFPIMEDRGDEIETKRGKGMAGFLGCAVGGFGCES